MVFISVQINLYKQDWEIILFRNQRYRAYLFGESRSTILIVLKIVEFSKFRLEAIALKRFRKIGPLRQKLIPLIFLLLFVVIFSLTGKHFFMNVLPVGLYSGAVGI